MKIGVTGSLGFIGSRLCLKLKKLNIDVVCLDIKNGFDITDRQQIQAVEKIDMLFHLAAKSYVPDSYLYPYEFYHLNVLGTINALELCRIHNAKMTFVSSYLYGHPQYLPIDEEHPVSACNPYAHTKLISEQICAAYNQDFGLPVVILRPFNVYGYGQNENFLIPSIISQLGPGKILLKDPAPRRDYVHIDDVLEMFVKLIDYEADFDVFNVGSGQSYSVREIAEMLCTLSGKNVKLSFSNETRPNEINETAADITKAKKLLGWTPRIELKDGLRELFQAKK